ncbi:MAG: sulfur oxidation c-type cytochrome SoxX [Limnohabitans sp.]|mgnify:CR=1 FL=1|uniref:sulfur oxidation c-type cytochrome SoxX n=1 Tax=Limnohabitans sp. TaxID=1907725 RepID=UPI0011D6FFE2|nr:MAG: sulfur oxidation c-type cytochrome SoxX [Limnohabitans sp.]
MNKKTAWMLSALAAVVLAGCATGPSVSELNDLARQVAKASFRDEGIVKADKVLNTDETNRLCSEADVAGKPLDEATAKRVEEMNFKTIQWPADGKFLGDWKLGEAIAQSGRGLTFTDSANVVSGGNCYNCHQISKEEISFGTIGPSLYNYGKIRGVSNPDSPESKAIVEYTWGKIWNSKAYNACSNMPRAGHMGILTAEQVRHVVALLLDPKSPVNR